MQVPTGRNVHQTQSEPLAAYRFTAVWLLFLSLEPSSIMPPAESEGAFRSKGHKFLFYKCLRPDLAEREGFEPSVTLLPHRFSRPKIGQIRSKPGRNRRNTLAISTSNRLQSGVKPGCGRFYCNRVRNRSEANP